MKLCQTTADLQEEVALAKAAGKSIGLVPTMGAPVSYTHLDVYKRQVPMRSLYRLALPWI